jgi:hypothetical protein
MNRLFETPQAVDLMASVRAMVEHECDEPQNEPTH